MAPPRDLRDADLLRALKALSDPNRFRMVEEIAAAGELTCTQVAERFDFSQPTVSHHLKLLTDAGILSVRAEGKHHLMSVDRPLVERVLAVLASRLGGAAKPARAAR